MKTSLKKIIIDSDAKNEIDDQFAIAYAVLSDAFEIRGITAAHYGKEGSMEKSHEEILHVLSLFGRKGDVTVYAGAGKALADHATPRASSAADVIISEALRAGDFLYVICIGPLTNLASAYLTEPAIKDKIRCIWLAGKAWPAGGLFFNNRNDIIAAQAIFSSGIDLTLIPAAGTADKLKVHWRDRRHIQGKGDVGDYLWKLFMRRLGIPKAIYDVVAVAALKIPGSCTWLTAPRPELLKDGTYDHSRREGSITVVTDIKAEQIKKDFFAALATAR